MLPRRLELLSPAFRCGGYQYVDGDAYRIRDRVARFRAKQMVVKWWPKDGRALRHCGVPHAEPINPINQSNRELLALRERGARGVWGCSLTVTSNMKPARAPSIENTTFTF